MKIKRTLSALMITLMTVLMLLTNVFAASNNRQYVMVSYLDPEMGGVETVVVEGTGRAPVENQYSNLNSDTTEFYYDKKYSDEIIIPDGQQQNKKKYYAYSWTGTYANNMISATSADGAQAAFVAGTLNSSMNNALSFILTENRIVGELTAKEMQSLVRLIPACKIAGKCGDTTIKGKKINLAIRKPTEDEYEKSKINSSRISKQTLNDYITLVVNGKTLTTLWSIEKGYGTGQYLSGLHSNEGNDDSWKYNVNKLSLAHIAYSADRQFDKSNQVISDYYDNTNSYLEGGIAWILISLITSVTDGIKSGFNLYNLEDMMLGTGVRNTRYFLGIMPDSWFSGARFLFAISSAIAIGIVGFGILRLILQMNKAAINSQARVDYQEGIYKLIATIILLLLFYPLFTLLANVNYWIVQGFAEIPSNIDAMSNIMAQSNKTWAGIVISVCYLATLIKINVTYIIRAVTVGLLFAFGPLFIATLSTQDKAPIFWTWLKELIGNLFMQSIHAMVMVFYLLVISGTRMTGIEKVVIVMSLIPLTSFFKNTLLMLTSGTDKASESIGAKLFGASSFAMGMAAIVPGTALNLGLKGMSLGAGNENKVINDIGKAGEKGLEMDLGDRLTGLTAAGMTMAGGTNDGFSSQGVNAFRREFRFDKPKRQKGNELSPAAVPEKSYTIEDSNGKHWSVERGNERNAVEIPFDPQKDVANYFKDDSGNYYPYFPEGADDISCPKTFINGKGQVQSSVAENGRCVFNTKELDAWKKGQVFHDNKMNANILFPDEHLNFYYDDKGTKIPTHIPASYEQNAKGKYTKKE